MLSISDTLTREAAAAIAEAQRRAYVTNRTHWIVRRGNAVHIVTDQPSSTDDNVLAVALAGGAPYYAN